jgi:hypothetical protein
VVLLIAKTPDQRRSHQVHDDTFLAKPTEDAEYPVPLSTSTKDKHSGPESRNGTSAYHHPDSVAAETVSGDRAFWEMDQVRHCQGRRGPLKWGHLALRIVYASYILFII